MRWPTASQSCAGEDKAGGVADRISSGQAVWKCADLLEGSRPYLRGLEPWLQAAKHICAMISQILKAERVDDCRAPRLPDVRLQASLMHRACWEAQRR